MQLFLIQAKIKKIGKQIRDNLKLKRILIMIWICNLIIKQKQVYKKS